MNKILFVVLVCGVVVQSAVLPHRSKLRRFEEKSESQSKVDSRIISSGLTNSQQSNNAETNSGATIRDATDPKQVDISQNTKADVNQKTATQGGSVQASENSESTAINEATLQNEKKTIRKISDSKANENVVTRGASQVSQNTGASTAINTDARAGNQSVIITETTNTRLDEKVSAAEGGKAQASQASTTSAKEKLDLDEQGNLNVNQSSDSQANEQASVVGPVKISQSQQANTVDKVNVNKPIVNAVTTDKSGVKNDQQIGQKSGSTQSSQRSRSTESASLNATRNAGGVDVKVVEQSGSKAVAQTTSDGVALTSQKEASRASENTSVKVDGENIDVKDSSDAKASNKIAAKGGKAWSSQKSTSKSSERLKASVS